MSSSQGGDGLNSAQRTAVTTLKGPLLVLAGAGTGKTRVITYRIAELIRDGTLPNRILAVTFTNKAAREMRERAMSLLGRRKKNQAAPEISTFHSLCVRVLRRHAQRLGYPENFSIYDRGDQESLARSALRDIRVGHQKLRPGDLIPLVSGWKSAGLTAQEAEQQAKKDVELLAAMAYGRYQAQLRASGAMDFDDLLLNAERLFREHPEARFAEASRFDHLLIDEYQDTNGLQYRIVKALAGTHRNLCVVGDDDQSIYGWRGAEVEHILHFQNDWPEARVVRLEENYRCTEWIIHLANNLIAHNKTRHDKVLRAARGRGAPPRFLKFEDEDAEAESIAAEIHSKIFREDHERVPASSIAILFRTNEQPRAFEQALRRAGIPYVLVGGQSFYDRKEVKDLLCYLRVLANPNDEVSLLRVINTPSRGIGTSSIQALLDQAVELGEPLWKVLPRAPQFSQVSTAAAQAVEGFRMLIDEFRARLDTRPLSQSFGELLARVDYKSEVERMYKDPTEQEARLGSVEQLLNSIVTYEKRSDAPSLLGFLEESTLASSGDDGDDDERREHSITLMTLHSAKGLEFPEVYLVGLEEGFLPHKRSVIDAASQVDEERRLAYVGVTRAQNVLTLSCCRHRRKWGKLRPQIPSRFLLEMRGETAKANELAQAAYEQLSREVERHGDDSDEAEGARAARAQMKKSKRSGGESTEPPKKPARTTVGAEPPAPRKKPPATKARPEPTTQPPVQHPSSPNENHTPRPQPSSEKKLEEPSAQLQTFAPSTVPTEAGFSPTTGTSLPSTSAPESSNSRKSNEFVQTDLFGK